MHPLVGPHAADGADGMQQLYAHHAVLNNEDRGVRGRIMGKKEGGGDELEEEQF